MFNDDEDDVPLLNDDNEQLITSEDRQPDVKAVFIVTFDAKDGKKKVDKFSSLRLFYEYH